jgi:trehalose 6-phosphate phosphatase
LFLDFDGTLADIAPTPDLVVFSPETRQLLQVLQHSFSGAVAIVTGRNVSEIDAHLAPVALPIAGLYGLTHRSANGDVTGAPAGPSQVARVARVLKALADQHVGLLLERKGDTIALHYRARPELVGQVRAVAQASLQGEVGLKLIEGKMVVEIAPSTADKGQAIRRFLREAPFLGRRPIYAGDDVSDEAAFAVVRELGGISIKVGAGPSLAAYRVRDIAHLFRWMRAIVAERPLHAVDD